MAQRVSTLVIACACAVMAQPVLLAGPARACSGLSCAYSAYFPRTGVVPANLKGFYWWPARDVALDDDGGVPEGGELRLARVDGSEPVLIEVTLEPMPFDLAHGPGYLVVPATPFVAGGRYVAWDGGCHEALDSDVPPPVPQGGSSEAGYIFPADDGLELSVARFTVAAASPLPSELGRIDSSGYRLHEVWLPDTSGSCAERVDVIGNDLELSLSAAAEAWKDALFYETRVDGERYNPIGNQQIDPQPGTPLAGREGDLVYALCIGSARDGVYSEGVETGMHTAMMRAHVPGELDVLTSNEVELTLSCLEYTEGILDGGARPSPDAAIGNADGGGDGDRIEATAVDDDDGCSTTGASSTSSPLLIALAVMLATRRRHTARR